MRDYQILLSFPISLINVNYSIWRDRNVPCEPHLVDKDGELHCIQQQGKKEGQFPSEMAPYLLSAGKVRKEGYEERNLRSLFF